MGMTESTKQSGKTRPDVAILTAAGVMTVGCVVLVTSLLLPPPGEIDNSVLVAFGEISTFAGAVFGVKKLR